VLEEEDGVPDFPAMTLLHELVLQVEPIGVGDSPEPAKIHDVDDSTPGWGGKSNGGLWWWPVGIASILEIRIRCD
jgi:hypothetical protein